MYSRLFVVSTLSFHGASWQTRPMSGRNNIGGTVTVGTSSAFWMCEASFASVIDFFVVSGGAAAAQMGSQRWRTEVPAAAAMSAVHGTTHPDPPRGGHGIWSSHVE
jgi:hypothetical protein